ncbi:hypothetical protein ACFQX4_21580 [Roseomonas sp. GCM10028921]
MSENLLEVESDIPEEEAPPARAERPEGVPEKFRDTELGELRVEALLKSYRELERKLSARFVPPGDDAPEEERQRSAARAACPTRPRSTGWSRGTS